MPTAPTTASHNRLGAFVSSGEIVFILSNRLSEAEDPRRLGNRIV